MGLILWVALGLVALLLDSPLPQVAPVHAQFMVASLALLFGIWTFWRHGGRQVTAAGLASLAFAVFVGYAGLWWLSRMGDSMSTPLFTATATAYFAHVLMYYLFWHNRAADPEPLKRAVRGQDAVWAGNLGVVMLLAAVALSRVAPSSFVAYSPTAFAGIVLLTLGMATTPTIQRFSIGRSLFVGCAVLLYVGTIFSGYGRLTVVALVAAVAMIISTRFNHRTVKAAVLIGAPVLAWVLGMIRRETVTELYGSGAVLDADAAGSIELPLHTFARLLSTTFDFGHGSSFWGSLTVFVPRSWWAEKPIGFGAELTQMFEPQFAGSGHSMASLTTGEWYFNFGWPGVVLMVVVVGLGIRWLDGLLATALSGQLDSRRALMRVAFAVTAAAGMGDLVWGGSFTYAERTVFRIGVLALLWLLFAWRVPKPEATRPPRSSTVVSRR